LPVEALQKGEGGSYGRINILKFKTPARNAKRSFGWRGKNEN